MKLINFRLLVSDFPAALKFWRDMRISTLATPDWSYSAAMDLPPL